MDFICGTYLKEYEIFSFIGRADDEQKFLSEAQSKLLSYVLGMLQKSDKFVCSYGHLSKKFHKSPHTIWRYLKALKNVIHASFFQKYETFTDTIVICKSPRIEDTLQKAKILYESRWGGSAKMQTAHCKNADSHNIYNNINNNIINSDLVIEEESKPEQNISCSFIEEQKVEVEQKEDEVEMASKREIAQKKVDESLKLFNIRLITSFGENFAFHFQDIFMLYPKFELKKLSIELNLEKAKEYSEKGLKLQLDSEQKTRLRELMEQCFGEKLVIVPSTDVRPFLLDILHPSLSETDRVLLHLKKEIGQENMGEFCYYQMDYIQDAFVFIVKDVTQYGKWHESLKKVATQEKIKVKLTEYGIYAAQPVTFVPENA